MAQQDRAKMSMRIQEEVNRPLAKAHPAVSAAIFAERTNKNRGESYNLREDKFAEENKSGRYVVGGENDPKGNRIRTQYLDTGHDNPQMTADDAAKHIERVRLATKDAKGAQLGSWVNEEEKAKGVQMDASRAFSSKSQANRLMEARGEDAMWDTKTYENIYNAKKKKA
jgi:hypothetical protein